MIKKIWLAVGLILIADASFIFCANDGTSSANVQPVNKEVLKAKQTRRDQLAGKSGKTVEEHQELDKLEVEIKAMLGK